jgi:hypothetical protein
MTMTPEPTPEQVTQELLGLFWEFKQIRALYHTHEGREPATMADLDAWAATHRDLIPFTPHPLGTVNRFMAMLDDAPDHIRAAAIDYLEGKPDGH